MKDKNAWPGVGFLLMCVIVILFIIYLGKTVIIDTINKPTCQERYTDCNVYKCLADECAVYACESVQLLKYQNCLLEKNENKTI